MSGKRLNIIVENRRIGYVEGPQANRFLSVLAGAYGNDWKGIAESVPSSKTTGVYHLLSPEDCFYKEFYDRDFFERIKASFKGGRSQRHIKQSAILLENNFNTPALLASGKFGKNSFVITQSVVGVSFGEYVSALLRRPKDPAQLRWKRTLFSSLGTIIGQLHNAGIVHGDLRPNNILLGTVNKQPTWFFIDNERNSKHKVITRTELIKNLVQINMFHPIDMNLSDRRRLFKAYFNVFQTKFDHLAIEREVLQKVFLRLESKPLVQPDYAKVVRKAGQLPWETGQKGGDCE